MKANTTRLRDGQAGCRAWLVLALMLTAIRAQSAATMAGWGDDSFLQTSQMFGLANVAAIGCEVTCNFAIESKGSVSV